MRAASSVFCSRQAIVIGPVPPGIGVIAPAICDTGSKSTSPTMPALGARDADIDHRCARLHVRGGDHPRLAGRGDDDVGLAADLDEIARARMGQRDRRVDTFAAEQQRPSAGRPMSNGRRRRRACRPSGSRSARATASRRAACNRRGPRWPRTSRPSDASVRPSTSFSAGIIAAAAPRRDRRAAAAGRGCRARRGRRPTQRRCLRARPG